MLVLAIHTVADQTAKVPFSAVLLKELASSPGKVPQELRLRQLLPTSGPVFTSLWDAPSAEALQQWLDRTVNVNVSNRTSEVHEAFALGLGDVVRQRAGDQLAAGASAVGSQVKTAAKDIDDRLHITEKTAGAVEAVRESQVGKGFESARRSAALAAQRVAESERYQAAAQAASNQVKKFQNTFSSWKDRAFKRGGGAAQAGTPTDYAPLEHTSAAQHSEWGAPLGAAAPAEHYAPVTLSSPPAAYAQPAAQTAQAAAAPLAESKATAPSTLPVSSPPPSATPAQSAASPPKPAAQSSSGASFSLVDDEP